MPAPRDHTEILFIIEDSDGSVTYARTPDEVGFYFYADRDEAEGDVCDPVNSMRFDSHRDFNEYRERKGLQ